MTAEENMQKFLKEAELWHIGFETGDKDANWIEVTDFDLYIKFKPRKEN